RGVVRAEQLAMLGGLPQLSGHIGEPPADCDGDIRVYWKIIVLNGRINTSSKIEAKGCTRRVPFSIEESKLDGRDLCAHYVSMESDELDLSAAAPGEFVSPGNSQKLIAAGGEAVQKCAELTGKDVFEHMLFYCLQLLEQSKTGLCAFYT